MNALAGLRVLEVAGPFGGYCGKLLADLGADVVLVEPPGGTALRRQPPMADGMSLRFAYQNANKRGICLDLTDPGDRGALMKLAAGADVLLQSGHPRRLRERGLAPERLLAEHPELVVTSITPFGWTGPYTGFEATDIVCLALGGLMSLGGYADGPPVQVCQEQSHVMASLFAAVGTLLALRAGRGQHVDVSAQESVSCALENAPQFFDLEGVVRGPAAGMQRHAGTGLYPCADGYVYLYVGGIASSRFWVRLTDWLLDEGFDEAAELAGPRWRDRAHLEREDAKERFAEIFGAFARDRGRAELYRQAQARGIPLSPVNTAADIVASPQLRHRDYFRPLTLPSGRRVDAPGPPYVLSGTPWRQDLPVPAPGEHQGITWPPRDPVAPRQGRIRVLDFTWVGAGSYTTKLLADHGADVIKVESAAHLDSLRTGPPFAGGVPGINRSGYFAERNTSKRGITLDLKTPEGREIAQRLAATADVVANNFRPGVMESLGLGYQELRANNPGLVYLSMSMQGGSGPERDYLGYGLTIGALVGLTHLTGLPGRYPAGTGTNYPDHVPNPGHAAVAVLAALRHRDRTGQGQHIDIAQTEPTIAAIGPAIMEWTANGTDPGPMGNAHPVWSPHGVYRCRDSWIALAVRSETEWQALRTTLDIEAPGEISGKIAAWDAEKLMNALQDQGVPAGVVRDAPGVITDPQLVHRGHWQRLTHPEMGPSLYGMPPFRLSATPGDLHSPAPLLGQHTREVLTGVLALTDAEIDRLTRDNVLR
ncbi:CoA transferase [Acrocarpospora macrocephala]|uniref:Putative CoA-transferase n=1 Tax=Acrocarpospora macrocephala TaxID=150177 RepID=A0A5M3WUF6_9ACTN|nr:CoA transferase [Acrocarpospora macrocephala]GES13087.1 putative CoA-transferase [Acrocarpospora macrocephala]